MVQQRSLCQSHGTTGRGEPLRGAPPESLWLTVLFTVRAMSLLTLLVLSRVNQEVPWGFWVGFWPRRLRRVLVGLIRRKGLESGYAVLLVVLRLS